MSRVLTWYEHCNAYIDNHLEDFLGRFYNSMAVPLTNGYRLNPCPMCGHNDCSTFTNSFVHCFSCGWNGNFVTAYFEYAVDKTNRSKRDAIKEIAEFCLMEYPAPENKLQREEEEKRERLSEIKRIAVDFYVQQLRNSDTKHELDGRKFKPLDYLKIVRNHDEETLVAFRVGFSDNYFLLKQGLQEEGYTEEEIKVAQVWMPQGVFIYPQWHPITKEILRFNTKNPFGMTLESKSKPGEEVEIQGFSRGQKVCGFAPGFSFNKPIIVVEGENDAQTIYESGDEKAKNVTWLAGKPKAEQVEILRKAKMPIYLMMDNDDAGKKHIEDLNDFLPDKELLVLNYDKNYNDPDDYYRKSSDRKTISELITQAEEITTDKFVTSKEGQVWRIENRHKQLVFNMDYIDDRKGVIVGAAKVFIKGVMKDSKTNTSLTKLPVAFKPLCLYLNDEIERYYNTSEGLADRSRKELIEMFKFSKYKADIIKAFARKIFNSHEEMEPQIIELREHIGQDSIDEVLREINDLQNRDVLDSLVTIPTLKLSHFFSIKNNDAYFYFTAVKYDGDTIRRIPYLLRNDGGLIRLDLLKRKDSQCLLLIDNKYELPEEVAEAKMKLSECSLVADWANKFHDGEITPFDISPYEVVSTIENYIRRFYYHIDENVYRIIALYIYGTYYYEMFGQFPYLFLNGEKGSGKTILDIVIYMFALNAKLAVNISEAALYRMVALEGGTMILDEIENLTSRTKTQDSLMATLLKGGYQRGGKAYRYNKDINASEGFDVFSPKVISNIFGVEDVIEDRCIRIDSFRMKVRKGVKMEDPKYYHQERLDEIRAVTSRAAISSLVHFQKLNTIYERSQMLTNNARLTQLLTPILALARFVDLSKGNSDYKGIDFDTLELESVTGEYSKAFIEYYKGSIVNVKEEIEDGTPEGVLKSIITRVAHELAGFVDEADREYVDSESHRYSNPVKYDADTGIFIMDALHMKVFMEETLSNWQVAFVQVHKLIKTLFRNIEFRRRDVKLEDCSEELLRELKGNKKIKIYHYEFNVKDFIPSLNTFTKEEPAVVKTEDNDLSSPF